MVFDMYDVMAVFVVSMVVGRLIYIMKDTNFSQQADNGVVS
jgi:hypothetical protein